MNFQGGTCEKVLERLNDIHDQGKDRRFRIAHVGTNDTTNNKTF